MVIKRTNQFQRTRADHSRETAEDYVELIDDLIVERGEARAKDIAERLGVSQVTVSKTIQRLAREGLVKSEPYRAVFLTPTGQDLAISVRRRHELVLKFLVALGVSEVTAEIDAEGIEHHVSDETLESMRQFLNNQR